MNQPIIWRGIILIILVVFGVIAGVLAYKNKGKKRGLDYYNFFIMGAIWLPFGILMKFIEGSESIGNIFFILGLIYFVIGLSNKDKWEKNKMPPLIKNKWVRGIIIGLLTLFLFLGIIYTYMYR